MNYTYRDKKLELSEQVKAVVAEVEPRLFPRDNREDTRTGAGFDGKTPFIDAFEEKADAPYSEALATGIAYSWTQSAPIVLPGELIVGTTRPNRMMMEHFSYGLLEYSHRLENDELFQRTQGPIWGRLEKVRGRMQPADNSELDAKGEEILGKEGFDAANEGLWWCGDFQGHTVPSYAKLLTRGLDGTLEEIAKYDANTNDEKKHELYLAMSIIIKGLSQFAINHADRAAELAAGETDETFKNTYLLVERTCRKIAHDAPETLLEACQLAWFYCLWDWVDCLGRADQFFLPFYERDADPVSREDIMAGFLMKTREHGVHNITLGGVKPENGECAVNELTYLILQILRVFHDTHPRASVRVGKETPAELMDLVVTMWSEGMSDPTLVSDTLVVDGLRRYGVSLADARDYTVLGCQEIEIPGKSNFGCEDGSFNLAKVLELTINNGLDRKMGVKYGLETGEFTSFTSCEELFEAYKTQLAYFTKHFTHLCNLGQMIRDKNLAKLVKTPFTDDCIARGVNLDGGGAIYNYGVVETGGLAVVADSFAALETVVFRDKKLTLEALKEALDANFEGYEDVRQLLRSAPKFGNDDDIVDKWAQRVLEFFWTEIGKYKSVRGGVYMGACSLLTGGNGYGKTTWALPDGHKVGIPMGNTMGPRPGADKNGTTAMLNSVAKLPLHLGLGGTTLNVLIPQNMTDTPEKRNLIAAMLRTYLENGGLMLQVTTASLEDLKDAQIHPENHEDLIVRVGGYSTKFVQMGKNSQNEIIRRYGE
ncbi:MAG: hypothetical protein IKV40_04620 [Clostridia bacterium]|nr:hypothetical protein [Clostridia bacterium]